MIIFLDTETLGLDPDRHDIWEVAAVWRDDQADYWSEVEWRLSHRLGLADPSALRVNHYFERVDWETPITATGVAAARWSGRREPSGRWRSTSANDVLYEIAQLTAGKTIAGANPAFDADRLERRMRRAGIAPAWDYHLLDVEAFAAGRQWVPPPWSSDDLSKRFEIEPRTDKHSALSDARWARDLYLAALAYDRDQG